MNQPSNRRSFPEPALTMNQVDAVLAERVAASRVEAATENGTVPVVVVPAEIIGPAGLRMALNAAANTRN